jgi:hypothetical protein
MGGLAFFFFFFFLVQAVLDLDPPILKLPAIEGMTGVHHSTQLLVEMGLYKFFLPGLAWNHNSSNLSLQNS